MTSKLNTPLVSLSGSTITISSSTDSDANGSPYTIKIIGTLPNSVSAFTTF